MPSINQFKYINLLFLLSHWWVHTSQSWENIFKELFLRLAMSNSCVNPFIYSIYRCRCENNGKPQARQKMSGRRLATKIKSLVMVSQYLTLLTLRLICNVIKMQSKVVLKSFAAANSVRSSNTASRSGRCFFKTNKCPSVFLPFSQIDILPFASLLLSDGKSVCTNRLNT